MSLFTFTESFNQKTIKKLYFQQKSITLLKWTQKQFQRHNSFIIPHFGLIAWNEHSSAWSVSFSTDFVPTCHGLITKVGTISAIEILHSNAMRCNKRCLSRCTTLTDPQIQTALEHLFTKLKETVALSATASIDNIRNNKLKNVKIHFGWGFVSSVFSNEANISQQHLLYTLQNSKPLNHSLSVVALKHHLLRKTFQDQQSLLHTFQTNIRNFYLPLSNDISLRQCSTAQTILRS
ncbi:hypothetical protein RFI_27875, partial [Reticulomyxa filosa]